MEVTNYYVDLIPKALALKIEKDVTLIADMLSGNCAIREIVEQVVYRLISNRESLAASDISEIINRIPDSFHYSFERLKQRLSS